MRQMLDRAVADTDRHPPSQCDGWKYPELTGTTDNWVELGCKKCAATEPGQSPAVLDPTTADADSGWSLPTNLSSATYSVTLVRDDTHNNYTFKVTAAGGTPLTIQWYSDLITWTLEDFHFHVPAEHVVVGQPVSVLEMHVKATAPWGDDKIFGVFAVQFAMTAGAPATLAPVANAMTGQTDQAFSLGALISSFLTQPIFIYNGGLTTPPCGTGAMFYVLQQPLAVDTASWQTIATALATLNGVSNARPLQARPLTNPSSIVLVSP